MHNEWFFINRFDLFLCRFFQYLGPSFKLPLINLVHTISFPFIYNPLRNIYIYIRAAHYII